MTLIIALILLFVFLNLVQYSNKFRKGPYTLPVIITLMSLGFAGLSAYIYYSVILSPRLFYILGVLIILCSTQALVLLINHLKDNQAGSIITTLVVIVYIIIMFVINAFLYYSTYPQPSWGDVL